MKEGKLNVYGVDITVKMLTEMAQDGCFGYSNTVTGEIFINDKQPESQKEITLIHELIHLCWSAMGLDKMTEITEPQINAIATEFYRLGFKPSEKIDEGKTKKLKKRKVGFKVEEK